MPQKTNLNVYPYFDDFNPNNIYNKILFKPGYPIQARELTTLQSMLQDQIERFGTWAFQEGSSVIPGSITYNDRCYAVELKNNFNGLSVFQYLPFFVGKTIRGQVSGIRAKIISSISDSESTRNNTTIYVNYLDSDYETSEYVGFSDGENLLIEENITAYISTDPDTIVKFQQNEAFASTIDLSCNSVGSKVSVESGVYFVRGYFIKNDSQFVILDQYDNNPSYKVGFSVIEDIITYEDDPSLNDNARGFLNYAAPGADRLAISLVLTKVPVDESTPENFIQLLEVRNGTVRSVQQDPRLNELGKELARRTYDESGDYYVKSPTLVVRENLDNLLGNEGIYNGNQLTFNGNVPSEDLGTYQISPLKAYVKGYEVETISPVFLDFQKTRTTKRLENQNITYNTGSVFSVNKVFGSPSIGLSTNYTISLRDDRQTATAGIVTGKEIGLARVYDFALESGSYNSAFPNANEWDISVYDVQTYTEIGLNENSTLSIPTYIKGKSSGATGYLRFASTNAGIITAYSVNGNFIVGEKLIFNDVENENTRVSTSIKAYTIDHVKSLYGIVGTAGTFSADNVQTTKRLFGVVDISAKNPSGVSVVSTTSPKFSGVVNVGDLVSYTVPGATNLTYSRVSSLTATTLNIIEVATVSGVNSGSLPTSNISVVDFALLGTRSSSSIDNTLYTILPKSTISDVDLTNSVLTIRKQFNVSITSNSTANISASENERFLPFDEENYVLITNNGTTERLSSDKFDIATYNSSGGAIIKFNGLSTASGTGRLIATLTKIQVKQKVKNKTTVNSIVVNKSRLVGSGIGETTLNNGLVYGNYPYGTRVEDDEICLLQPDVTKVYGIFEKTDSSNLNIDPNSPRAALSNIKGKSGTTNDVSTGELVIGEISNAVAVYVEKVNSNTIGFVYLNSETFIVGESIKFKTSLVSATVNSITDGDKNITSNFILDDGQRDTIYDYSRIIRKSSYNEPLRKIKIYFASSFYSTSDSGDITTVNSYQNFNYSEIPVYNKIRNSDILDIRPKVAKYTVAEGAKSPFEFSSRSFVDSYNNSSKDVLASDQAISFSYSYYLPRIDKIFLSKDGTFQVKSGEPSDNPQPPTGLDNSIEIAKSFLPSYIFDIKQVSITKNEYKRYTMADIKKLENRIENLEYYTTLSLLEKDTANLSIPDENGNTRFKSGFFVDNFTTTLYQQKDTIIKNSIDPLKFELRPTHYTTNCDLIIGESSLILDNNESVDINYSNDFIGTNIKKTGNVITLDYTEVVENQQEYATRVVDVSSYSTTDYYGSITLNPSSDTWISQRALKPNKVELEGDLTETEEQREISEDSEDTGFCGGVWRPLTYWKHCSSPAFNPVLPDSGDRLYSSPTRPANLVSTVLTGSTDRFNLDDKEEISLGNSIVSSDLIPYMRSRNIEFKAERMKPLTRLYGFFDNKEVTKYIMPKLLEIEMVSGTFQSGENVSVRQRTYFNSWLANNTDTSQQLVERLRQSGAEINSISDLTGILPDQIVGSSTETTTDSQTRLRRSGIVDNFRSLTLSNCTILPRPVARFRICNPNHKSGPYNAGTKKYNLNPYDRSQIIPDSYSSTSSILNIDTFSLSYRGQSNFYGYVRIGMQLVGESSGAVATVKDIRLITDDAGTLIGSFYIPSQKKRQSTNTEGLRFTAGEKVFRLTSSQINSLTPGIVISSAEEKFYSQGTLNSTQENILSVSRPRIAPEIPVIPPDPVSDPPSPPPSYPPSGGGGGGGSAPSASPIPIRPSTPSVPAPSATPAPLAINRGDSVYANAAQNRLINTYNSVNGTNLTSVDQVARRLGVDITTLPGGNITQGSGDRLVSALQRQGANIVPGPGSQSPTPNPRPNPRPDPSPSPRPTSTGQSTNAPTRSPSSRPNRR
jgi:hypothetical protein